MEEKGFLGGTVVKNPPANAWDMGSIPGPGRFLMPPDYKPGITITEPVLSSPRTETTEANMP